jgi:hypothetical protein
MPTSTLDVRGDASVSGNTSVSGNVSVGEVIGLSFGNIPTINFDRVSNVSQIKSNSNVVMEYRRSKKLIKYPRVALTSASQGGYMASASSVLDSSYPAWEAFNNTGIDDIHDAWLTPMNRYTLNNYIDVDPSVAANINGVYGEWLELKLPHKITLDRLTITSRAGSPYGQPGGAAAGNVWGSNDGVIWSLLTSFTGLTYGGVATTIGIPENVVVNSTTPYSYFRLQPTKRVGANGSDGWVGVGELQFFGLPEYDPEAHGTDVVLHTTPNVPNTDFSNVYYDGQDYTSMPATVADKSGNGVTGTPSGGVGFDSTYKAFTFDGVDDKITAFLTNPAGAWVHSASMWFKVNSLSAINTLFSVDNDTTGENNRTPIFDIHTDGNLRYEFWDNAIYFGGSGTIVPNKWYHLSVTYSGGSDALSRKVFLNGVELGISSTSGSSQNTALNAHANAILKIGVYPASTFPFNGSIANFRLYNRGLSADEIWELYAYQKEYFGVSPDVVTLKAGRVGIGTSEPRAVLDVRGDIIGRGIKFNNKVVVFSTNSTNGSTTMTEAARVYYTPIYCSGSQFQVVCEVTYGWSTAGSADDWFTVQLLDENDVALDVVYPRYLSGRMINPPKDLIGVITTSSSSLLTFKLVHRRWVADDANTVSQPRFKIYQILI